jgi:hypothetical protein
MSDEQPTNEAKVLADVTIGIDEARVLIVPVASLPPGSVITIRIGPEPRQAEAEVAAPPARKSFLNGPR